MSRLGVEGQLERLELPSSTGSTSATRNILFQTRKSLPGSIKQTRHIENWRGYLRRIAAEYISNDPIIEDDITFADLAFHNKALRAAQGTLREDCWDEVIRVIHSRNELMDAAENFIEGCGLHRVIPWCFKSKEQILEVGGRYIRENLRSGRRVEEQLAWMREAEQLLRNRATFVLDPKKHLPRIRNWTRPYKVQEGFDVEKQARLYYTRYTAWWNLADGPERQWVKPRLYIATAFALAAQFGVHLTAEMYPGRLECDIENLIKGGLKRLSREINGSKNRDLEDASSILGWLERTLESLYNIRMLYMPGGRDARYLYWKQFQARPLDMLHFVKFHF